LVNLIIATRYHVKSDESKMRVEATKA